MSDEKRPVIQTLDLLEQGTHKYVLFPPPALANMGVGAIGLDGYDSLGGVLRGYRLVAGSQTAGEEEIIVALPAHSDWAIYSTSLIRTISREDAMREIAADVKVHDKLKRELFPELEESPLAKIMDAMKGQIPPPSSTGQYL